MNISQIGHGSEHLSTCLYYCCFFLTERVSIILIIPLLVLQGHQMAPAEISDLLGTI